MNSPVCGGLHAAPQFIKEWAGKNASYQWNDANRDGLPQQAEVTFYEKGIANSFEPYTAADSVASWRQATARAAGSTDWPSPAGTRRGARCYGTMPQGERFGAMPSRFDPSHFADSRWSVFMGQDPKSRRGLYRPQRLDQRVVHVGGLVHAAVVVRRPTAVDGGPVGRLPAVATR